MKEDADYDGKQLWEDDMRSVPAVGQYPKDGSAERNGID
jgi:hypothetical protein